MMKSYNKGMCGRYLFYDQRNPAIQSLIESARKILPADQFAQVSLFEVFPSQSVFAGIYDSSSDSFKTVIMRWGYPGFHGNQVINCRIETYLTSSFFRGSLPCAVPACGYYEWSKQPHQKYYFTAEPQPVYLAGCWKTENNQKYMSVFTEAAKQPESIIHDRQPILLNYETAHQWCSGKMNPDQLQSASEKNRIMRPVSKQ